MAEAKNYKILLKDGREFSVAAQSYEPQSNTLSFRVDGAEVCLVLVSELAAVVDESALQGATRFLG